MTSSRFDLSSTSKILNLSLLQINEHSGSENLNSNALLVPVGQPKQDSTKPTSYRHTRNQSDGISVTEQLSFQEKKNHVKSKMNFLKLYASFFTMTKRFRSTMQKLMSSIVDLGRGFHGRGCHLGVADWVRWLRTLRFPLLGLGVGIAQLWNKVRFERGNFLRFFFFPYVCQ